MVVLPVALAVSIALALFAGGKFERLTALRLRGETVLIFMLVTQAVLPSLRLEAAFGRLAYAVWFATFPVMVLICLLNYRTPGMILAAMGLGLNGLVIGLNSGMPVSMELARALAIDAAVRIAPGDFIHVAMSEATRLPVLADILPVPGPAGFRGVASAGDILLVAGAAGVVAASMVGTYAPAHESRRKPQ